MFSPKTRRNIGRVIPFGIVWFIFSLIYCLLEKGLLGDLGYYPYTGNQYKFETNIVVIPTMGLVMGLLTGVLEIGYFSKWFIKNSFTRKIVLKSLIYLVIVIIFLAITVLINALYSQQDYSFENLITPARAFFTTYSVIGLMVYLASVIVITQFYTEFSTSIGAGTLSNFFFREIPSSRGRRKDIYVPGYEVLDYNR